MSVEDLKFHPAFIEFTREIEGMKQDYQKITNGSGSVRAIFRAQGAIEAIEKILDKVDEPDYPQDEGGPDE